MQTKMKKRILRLCTALLLSMCCNTATAQSDFWEQTNGPVGGAINELAINSRGDMFASTSGAGLFRSTDAGNSWSRVLNPLLLGAPEIYVRTVYVNSNDDILAAGSGLFRSVDNGESWHQIGSGLPDPLSVSGIVSQGDSIIFVAGFSGIFSSTDNGDTWSQIDSGLPTRDIVAIGIDHEGTIFVGTVNDYNAIFRSNDNGDSWHQTLSDIYARSFAVDGNGDILAGSYEGVIRSSDKGDTWTEVDSSLSGVLSILSANGNTYAGSYDGIFRLSDSGDSWEQIGGATTPSSPRTFVINQEHEIFVGTYLDGVSQLDQTNNVWEKKNQGLVNTVVYDIAFNEIGEIFVTTGDFLDVFCSSYFLFRSSDNGESWNEVMIDPDKMVCVSDLAFNNDGIIFVRSADYFRGDRLYLTMNNGDNWSQVDTNTVGTRIYGIASNGKDEVFVGSNKGFLQSSDSGQSWTLFQTGWSIRAFAFNGTGDIFAIGDGSHVLRSSDNGESWSRVFYSSAHLLSLAIDDRDNIFVAGHSGIFRSTNNGANWTPMDFDVPESFILDLAVDFANNLYLATREGVYRSLDKGDSWEPLGPQVATYALGVGNDGYVFVGTAGTGVYKSVSPITDVNDQLAQPSQFTLQQNYPNPFNPSTTIRFSLPHKSEVSLAVYDMLGRQIRILYNATKVAGNWTAIWDGTDSQGRRAASGVYVVKLLAGDLTATQKIMLIH